MPKFTMDTTGRVPKVGPNGEDFTPVLITDLGAFEQAYLTAMFYTSDELETSGFSNLAPETLASILADCETFKASAAYKLVREAEDNEELGDLFEGDGGVSSQAGHDFWLTRNGHGAGFWDGDWPEPHASALDEVAKGFGESSAYLGDNGLIYLS